MEKSIRLSSVSTSIDQARDVEGVPGFLMTEPAGGAEPSPSPLRLTSQDLMTRLGDQRKRDIIQVMERAWAHIISPHAGTDKCTPFTKKPPRDAGASNAKNGFGEDFAKILAPRYN